MGSLHCNPACGYGLNWLLLGYALNEKGWEDSHIGSFEFSMIACSCCILELIHVAPRNSSLVFAWRGGWRWAGWWYVGCIVGFIEE